LRADQIPGSNEKVTVHESTLLSNASAHQPRALLLETSERFLSGHTPPLFRYSRRTAASRWWLWRGVLDSAARSSACRTTLRICPPEKLQRTAMSRRQPVSTA